MSYVDDNLSKNEKVLFRARISKAVFLPGFLLFLISVVSIAFAYYSVATSSSTFFFVLLFFASIGVAFYALLLGIKAIVVLTTTEFAVTNRRVIAKTGFIRRHTVELLLMKVESVSITQSVLGRLFDFGIVTITGTGGTREKFQAISEPLEVRKKVNEILEWYMRAYAAYQEKKAVEQIPPINKQSVQVG